MICGYCGMETFPLNYHEGPKDCEVIRKQITNNINWIPYGGSWESFRKAGLSNPGVLVYIKGGKEFLIGDINELGGCCDDCVSINKDDIVEKYKVVWSK